MEKIPSRLIMKFGGAALATPDHFDKIADLIINRTNEFQEIVIVVSAMGKTTDELIELALKVNPNPPQREFDMLITVGERISMALLAMALNKKKQEAISFTGSQSGIITTSEHSEAKIIDIKPGRILKSLADKRLVIVAGFQGVSKEGEITTFGRGGSDTTAVALGIALNAKKVEFYKDVPGIFSCDPKQSNDAQHFEKMSYNEAHSIISKGAKVLHLRALSLAQSHNIPLHILPFDMSSSNKMGTLIEGNEERLLQPIYELVK